MRMLGVVMGLRRVGGVVAILAPIGHGGEFLRWRSGGLRGMEETRRARPPPQARQRWDGTIGPADVLPNGDDIVVLPNERADVLFPFGESDLVVDGISPVVHESTYLQPFFRQPRCPSDVQHRVGMGKQILGLRSAQAEPRLV